MALTDHTELEDLRDLIAGLEPREEQLDDREWLRLCHLRDRLWQLESYEAFEEQALDRAYAQWQQL